MTSLPFPQKHTRETKQFLSAAQPTDQGEESVVLVVVVVVVVVGGGPFSKVPCTVF